MRPFFSCEKVLFHQDNTAVHKSVIVMTKINELALNCFLLRDLIALGYFPNLKKLVGGKSFANKNEVESARHGYFEDYHKQSVESTKHC